MWNSHHEFYIQHPSPSKKTTNVSINSDLLEKAKGLHINLSATLEQALAEQLRTKQRAQWLQENAGAIEAYNLSAHRTEIIAAVDFVLSGI